MPITPQEFVYKWRGNALKERSAAQEHFLDLCHLIGHVTPAEDDPTGERFTFEAGAGKQKGGSGWADVWKRGYFAWEYKGKHADLGKAWQQLLQYRESLLNPPLLVVCDIERIVVHTNFTNTVKRTVEIGLDDLLKPAGMAHLRAIFNEPEHFKASQTVEQVTEQAAKEFARLAALLRVQEDDPQRIAHFLIRLLFCLFAEDIDLLPSNLFGKLGRPNSDVIKRWINATDVTRRPRNMWIIDFGTDSSQAEAAEYEQPFEYVVRNVKPIRDEVRRANHRTYWWRFGETRIGMRTAIASLERYIATPMVSKYRVFVWVSTEVVAENLLVVIAREDDYFFGVLHSRPHELWARAQGTQLREAESGSRYTPTTTFETFPFPWPPGQEPADDPRVQAIAQTAAELVAKRDVWLNPPGLDEQALSKRTLTNLYNQRPTWLALLHQKLDAAVCAAYGWPVDLSDEEILERLLALNLQRAGV